MTTTSVSKTFHDGAEASSRLLLEQMISSMREGVVVVESDFEIFTANPAARDLFSRLASKPETQNLRDVIFDEGVSDAFRRALENDMPVERRFELRLRNETRYFDLRVAPLSFLETSNNRRAIGIFYDITRLARLEKVRQEFLSNVSHELRTPLTSILAFVETLEDGALEDVENNRRFLETIRRNAERMHHLIDDILELTSIEAGKVRIEPSAFLLAPLVDDVFTTLAKKSSLRNIRLENLVAVDVSIFADRRRLEQILTNLVSNAIKFNRELGSVRVAYEKSVETHEISVADTGEGLDEKHIPRIFERFYRTDTARSRDLGGTGLGLAIVKHLSRLHGGETTVTSKIGEGSKFTVQLPDVKRAEEIVSTEGH